MKSVVCKTKQNFTTVSGTLVVLRRGGVNNRKQGETGASDVITFTFHELSIE